MNLRMLNAVYFCISVVAIAETQVPQQEPQPQQGTQFNTGADPKEEAKLQLNRGVEAFKKGDYNEAVKDFQRAKQLYPQFVNARLYLATTYAVQYIPGAPSEENRRFGERAVEEFKGVLELDPNNLSALDGAGSIAFQMAGVPYNSEMFSQAKSYFLKHIQIKPDDAEPYYWVGVIDWTGAYRANSEIRQKYNREFLAAQIKDNEPLPEHLRLRYVCEYGGTIEEGIESLRKAIALRTDYEDAMAYLSLLYRMRADCVAGASERAHLTEMADDLVDQVKEIKQKRATQRQ